MYLSIPHPIKGVTGNALPDDLARFVTSGANEVVTKPITKMKLLAAVDRYLPSIAATDRSIRRESEVESFSFSHVLSAAPTDPPSHEITIPRRRIQPPCTSTPLLTSSPIFIRELDLDEEVANSFPLKRRPNLGSSPWK